jgi:aminobenzoyl-glutamate utilization protein B
MAKGKRFYMKTKQELIAWVESKRDDFIRLSDTIWEHPEIAFKEFKASAAQAKFLQEAGFRITWDVAGMSTAFIAEWGKGKPIIAFLGEYDALLNLSQKAQPTPEPIEPGGLGHGCGHNLLGVGCLAAAAAVKEWLQTSGTPGTVRYYGCPAEENGNGKIYMVQAGKFDDVDAAFNYHPGSFNMPSKGTSVAVNNLRCRFHGRAAHAGGSPHLGRSALDAVELMNVGVNYLREHVTKNVRMHYTITHGGDLPNIVPPEAEVWYFLRAEMRAELAEVTERVLKIARGAALMTETTLEEILEPGCTGLLSNSYLADLQYAAMKNVGPILYTPEEVEFARTINDGFPRENLEGTFKNANDLLRKKGLPEIEGFPPLLGENYPGIDEDEVGTGSTDVGDVSWVTPLSMLGTACFSTAAPGHSWAEVATSGMSIGHKGMLHAAKIMAVAALDCYSDPIHLQKARQELEKVLQKHPYQIALLPHQKVPYYPNPERES